MKKHILFAALIVVGVGLAYASVGDQKTFLIMLAVALQLYSLTEMQHDWTEKFSVRNLHEVIGKRYKNSMSGSIAGLAAILCVVGYFIHP